MDKRAQETIQAVQAFAKDRKAIEEIEAVIGVLGPILFPIFREGLGLKRMEARIEAIHKLVEAIQEGLENVDGPATGIPDDTSKPPG